MLCSIRAFGALSSRDFTRLWLAQALSQLGDAAFLVALAWRTFTLTGSTRALGFVLAAEFAGMLLTLLVGGALADRFSRKRIMVLADLGRFAAVGLVVAADAADALSVSLLVGCTFAVGLGSGFFEPAYGGIVPLLVEEPQLPSANALIGLAKRLSAMVGPAFAGALYGIAGPTVVFGANAFSFLFSAVLLAGLRPRAAEALLGEGTLRGVWSGIRYVASVPWLWVSIALFSFVLMVQVAPFTVLLPKLVDESFGRGVGAYGALVSLVGVGTVLGALAFGQVGIRRRRGLSLYVLWIVATLAVAGVALAPWLELAGGFAVARGVAWGFSIALWGTMVMTLVPGRLLSRVFSVDYFGSIGLMPLGFLLAGAVAPLAAPEAIMTAGALIASALLLLGLLHPRVRGLD